VPQGGEVGGQVAVDNEYVGVLPAPKKPLRPAEPDRCSCAAGGSDERRHGAGYLAKLDHRVGVVAVSLDVGDAGVGTGNESDAECLRRSIDIRISMKTSGVTPAPTAEPPASTIR
jgi:hypothetical protein